MKQSHIINLRRLAQRATVLALTLLGTSSLQAGLHVWTGNGQFGPYFSDGDNWKSGFVPAANETNVTLEFPIGSGSSGPIVDIPNLKVDKLVFQGGYVLYGQPQGSKLTIRGTTDAIVSSLSTTFHNSLELILEGATEVDVAFSRTVEILGKVSGAGGLVKTGLGTMDIGGSISNTYTGDTEIKTGTVRLMKATGTAVSGNIIVGDGIGATDTDILKLSNDNQIVDTASMTIKESGIFQMSINDETIGSLTLKGGHVATGTGVLLVSGSITSQASTEGSLIEGNLNLGVRGKIINVEDGALLDDLVINAIISGSPGVGFSKSGTGMLVLGGANTFSGPVTINTGFVKATHGGAFGATSAGTSVAAGAALWLNGAVVLNEPLSLSGKGPGNLGTLAARVGSGVWSGPITLLTDVVMHADAGVTLNCGDSILGSGGITKLGEGDLNFTGINPNSYTGTTTVLEGVLRLNKSSNVISLPGALVVGHPSNSAFPRDKVVVLGNNQIANNAAITTHITGILQFDGASDGVGSLDLTGGEVIVNSATLTLLGPVHCSAPTAGPAFITGSGGVLSLGAQSRIFTLEANSTLRVTIPIIGNNLIGLIKQGAGLLEFTAANTYSGITSIEDGTLLVTGPDGTLGSTTSGTVVSQGAQLVTSWVQIGSEALLLSGDAPGSDRASYSAHGDCTWAGPISINGGTNTIEVQTVRLIASGAISGTGALRVLGHTINNNPTKLWISGLDANTYTGGTTVDTCEVWLSKLTGKSAIPGALTVLNRAAGESPSRLFFINGEQLSDSSPVRLGLSAEMNLGNVNETIGSLELYGAKSTATNGVLTLHGDISVLGGATSTIAGALNLGTASRTIDVQGDTGGITELQLSAIISAGAPAVGYRKTGKGDMSVSGKNTYGGLTRIQEGVCRLFNNFALGDTVGETLVDAGGILFLTSDVDIAAEKLTLNGAGNSSLYNGALMISGNSTNEWTGPITLASDTTIVVLSPADRFIHSGILSGPGSLVKDGAGTFEMAGGAANTFTGTTTVAGGVLALNKSGATIAIPGNLKIGDGIGGVNADVVRLLKADQIANLSAVSMASSALFDLNSLTDTIGSLEGEGNVNLVLGTLTTGNNNSSTAFAGGIGGVGFTGLIKIGSGTMTLTGESTYTGKTLVQGGKLLVNGHQPSSPVWVSGAATLGGNGTIGLLASTNGVVSPGNSPGKLNTGNLAMNSSSIYLVELNGPDAGTGYDQLAVTGSVALGGAQLQVKLNYNPIPGTEFVIISNDSNDPVQQTFAGLQEGAKFTAANGTLLQISYHGGDGNDVVLRHVNTPPSIVSVSATPNVKEGGSVEFNVVLNDPDLADAHKVVVSWGDGSAPDTYDLQPGSFGLTVQHQYADDNPTATPNDAYTISVAAFDNAGIGSSTSLVINIQNVAPSFKTLADSTATEQTLWTRDVTFVDPGADSWTASVDYGDGTGLQAVPVGPSNTLALSHTYTNAGTYTVHLTVKDDDGGTGTAQFKVVVEALGQGPTLSIKPGPGDRVTISWPASNVGYTLESTSDINSGSWTPVAASDTEINGEVVVIVPALSPQQFFRLKK